MRPRRVGTFLMSRRPTSAKLSARSRIASISSRLSSSIASRCFMRGPRRRSAASEIVTSSTSSHLLEPHVDSLLAGGRQVLADVVGPEGQLAVAPVAEHRQLDAARAPVIEDRLDHGPHRAAGEEHVVDEDDGSAGEVEVDVGGVDDRLGGRGPWRRRRRGRRRCRRRRSAARPRSARRAVCAGGGEDGAARVDTDDREALGIGFFSAISWAMRCRVLRRSSRSSTTFSLKTSLLPGLSGPS